MPKETKEKNNKAKKTTRPNNSKNANKKNYDVNKKKKVVRKEEAVVEVVERPIKKEEEKSIATRITDNTPFAISLCVIVILLALVIFLACYKRVPRTSEGKEVLATLKGKKITADDLYEQLKENGGTDALLKIVDDYIAEKEIKITEDDNKYVDEVVKYYKDYAEYYGVDLETFLANYVGLAGVTTEDEFREYVLNDYKKTLAVVKFVGDNADKKEIEEYYKNNYSDKITAKHILIEVDADAKDQDAADAEALKKAKKIIKKLDETDAKKLDAKFDELALDNSDDTATYSNGGLMEDFTKNSVVSEFYEAASKLKDGEYTKEPVKTQYGYHVILKVSSTPVEKLEDIIDEVKKAFAQDQLSQDSTLITKKWDELRKQYKLSIKDDAMNKDYEKSIKDATKSEDEETEKDESSKKE